MEELHAHCLNCVNRRCMIRPETGMSCDLIRCPLVCGAVFHSCKVEEHHLLCPFERVPCLNTGFGCPFTIPRIKMAEHLETCPASVVCCTMEWNRWPVSHSDRKSYEHPSDVEVVEQLDMALALQDQRMLLESLRVTTNTSEKENNKPAEETSDKMADGVSGVPETAISHGTVEMDEAAALTNEVVEMDDDYASYSEVHKINLAATLAVLRSAKDIDLINVNVEKSGERNGVLHRGEDSDGDDNHDDDLKNVEVKTSDTESGCELGAVGGVTVDRQGDDESYWIESSEEVEKDHVMGLAEVGGPPPLSNGFNHTGDDQNHLGQREWMVLSRSPPRRSEVNRFSDFRPVMPYLSMPNIVTPREPSGPHPPPREPSGPHPPPREPSGPHPPPREPSGPHPPPREPSGPHPPPREPSGPHPPPREPSGPHPPPREPSGPHPPPREPSGPHLPTREHSGPHLPPREPSGPHPPQEPSGPHPPPREPSGPHPPPREPSGPHPPPREPSGPHPPPREPSGPHHPPREPSGPHLPPREPSGPHPPQEPSGPHPPPREPSGPHPPQEPSGPHPPPQEPSGPHLPPREPSGPHPPREPSGPHPPREPSGRHPPPREPSGPHPPPREPSGPHPPPREPSGPHLPPREPSGPHPPQEPSGPHPPPREPSGPHPPPREPSGPHPPQEPSGPHPPPREPSGPHPPPREPSGPHPPPREPSGPHPPPREPSGPHPPPREPSGPHPPPREPSGPHPPPREPSGPHLPPREPSGPHPPPREPSGPHPPPREPSGPHPPPREPSGPHPPPLPIHLPLPMPLPNLEPYNVLQHLPLEIEDSWLERKLQNLQVLRGMSVFTFNGRRALMSDPCLFRAKTEDRSVDTSDLEVTDDPLGLHGIDLITAALLFCLGDSPGGRSISDSRFVDGYRIDFGTQTFSFPSAILATNTMVGDIASASACDHASPQLSNPSPFHSLRLDLVLECVARYQTKRRTMFTFVCGQLFRRDEFSSHFKNVHGDIHAGLNGWLEHRCPLAYYGCTYSQRRLCPSVQGSRIIHDRHLGSFGVQPDMPPQYGDKTLPRNACRFGSTCDHLSSLPFEVLQYVASFLDGFSLCQLSRVSRTMRDVCASLLQSRGMVVLLWENTRRPDGSSSWQIRNKVWRFSTAFGTVNEWKFANIANMADHLKKCKFNSITCRDEAIPLPCMCLSRELTKEGRSLRSVLKPVL